MRQAIGQRQQTYFNLRIIGYKTNINLVALSIFTKTVIWAKNWQIIDLVLQ